MGKLITLWERFEILYAAEGRDVKECYAILKDEGFETGLWMSFKGRYSKLPNKKTLDGHHLISKSLREFLDNIQPSIQKMAMDVILRLRVQMAGEKTLSIEKAKDFIKLLGDVLALSPKHPKYSTTNRNLNVNADLSWEMLVEIFYRTVKKVPETNRVFKDPMINEKFLNELQKTTVQVQKGQLLLDSAPEAARGEVIDA